MADLDLDLERAIAGVSAGEVSAVLNRAAELLETYGWAPTSYAIHQVDGMRRPAGRITALQAITLACDEIGGRGVWSVELHMASLDAVCRRVFGPRALCGVLGKSVSRWERQSEQSTESVIALLRGR